VTGVCPSCGAVQSQAWLCHDCSAALEVMLAAAPQLLEQLDVAISKQAKAGGNGKAGQGTAHTKSPINFGALAVRDALMVELAFVGEDVNWVRSHPQAGEMLAKLGRAVKDAYRAIDRMQERQYLGRCGMYEPGHEDQVCQAELWARPGAKEVKCRLCEHVHTVATRRVDLLEMAEDLFCTVKEASSYMGEVGHIVVTEASIRGYLHRNRLAYRPGTTMIRLGDLLDVVVDEGERRTA
jgi:hypothetical protein